VCLVAPYDVPGLPFQSRSAAGYVPTPEKLADNGLKYAPRRRARHPLDCVDRARHVSVRHATHMPLFS